MLQLLLPTALLLSAAVQDDPAASAPEGWTLAWNDEFDAGEQPDESKWSYDYGFLRNEELQLYTDRPENVRIEDGHLILEGRKERVENPNHDPDHPGGEWNQWRYDREYAEYTAANIITKGKFEFTYGRIEMRAKLPDGQGMWPAFWTLGENIDDISWPRCGEIDVMEWVGKEPDYVHGTVHFATPETAMEGAGTHAMKGDKLAVENVVDDFHVWAAEWGPDEIKFFYDGENYFTFDVADADPVDADGNAKPEENPFRKPHYILLNFAIGGTWGGPIGEDVTWPQQYIVDYVRVYEKDDAAAELPDDMMP